jgi:hypothetical protein
MTRREEIERILHDDLERARILFDAETNEFRTATKRMTPGQAFAIRDVMVPLASLEYVRSGEENQASRLVRENRYSVVPVSKDDIHFDAVFCTDHPVEGDRCTG